MRNNNKIVSNNPIVNKILELNSMDIIISSELNDNYDYMTLKDLVRTGFHLLVASLCVSVVNLSISTGDPEVDDQIKGYRNYIIHFEGDTNLREFKFNIFTIVDIILDNFKLEQRNNNRIYSNVYTTKLL